MENGLAYSGARAVYMAFDSYQSRFSIITRRAQARFEHRDWMGMREDAAERLDVYNTVVDSVVCELHKIFEGRLQDKTLWRRMKEEYSTMILYRNDYELGETFYNSVTRRIFTTVGVDSQVEFVDTDFTRVAAPAERSIVRDYNGSDVPAAVRYILQDLRFGVPFQDFERDVHLAAKEITTALRNFSLTTNLQSVQLVRSIFFRGRGAYIVGRILSSEKSFPLAMSLLNTEEGIIVDAVLMTEDEVSILFSFTRSYFHVQAECASELVHFLKEIMPRKPVAELYISIGRNKHGKTEFYRDLLRHMATSREVFEIAPGARGMVMIVFTLPSYEVVFKIIKDRFDHPKNTTRAEVMQKYRLVFAHDRAGRLVDAQEFEHLRFERELFSPDLLNELLSVAGETVKVDGDYVVCRHLYTERRLTPLDIYLRQPEAEAVEAAVLDFGNAIKDLARANVFTGDVLAKNFGVTRHGRVVSYDYDELCLLTDCSFRTIPSSNDYLDELSADPWYYVGENDYFPEEFSKFLGIPNQWKKLFETHHQDLFTTAFWFSIQERILSGEVIQIFPYPENKRFVFQARSSK